MVHSLSHRRYSPLRLWQTVYHLPPVRNFPRLFLLKSPVLQAPSHPAFHTVRGFEVIVSVAVIAIFSSLIPLAAQIPFPLTAFGIAVYDIGLSGKSISKCEITVLYFLFCFFIASTDTILSNPFDFVNTFFIFFKKVFLAFVTMQRINFHAYHPPTDKRRRRDLNPRAAINDLLPFQGSPFSQLGYFSIVCLIHNQIFN